MNRRLLLEDVEPRASEMARGEGRGERRLVDDRPTRGVDEDRALLHPRQLGRAETPSRLRHERRVERQDVGLGQKALEGLGRIALHQREHFHPERLGAPGHRAADPAEAVDAERHPFERGPHQLQGLPSVPAPGADQRVAFAEAPRDGEDEEPRQVGGRLRQDSRRVRHDHAPPPTRVEVDVVRPDGAVSDDPQVRREGEESLGHLLPGSRDDGDGIGEVNGCLGVPGSRTADDDLETGEDLGRGWLGEGLRHENLHGRRVPPRKAAIPPARSLACEPFALPVRT